MIRTLGPRSASRPVPSASTNSTRSALARSSANTTIVENVAESTSASSTKRRGGGKKLSEAMNIRSSPHPTAVVSRTPSGIGAATSQKGE